MKTTYTDSTGSILTEIHNQPSEEDRSAMFMELNGLIFEGSSFDDFELISESYSESQVNRFPLRKIKYRNSDNESYELCDYSLEFDIPTILIDSEQNKEEDNILKVLLELGKPTTNGGLDHQMATFQITINQTTYSNTGGYFEDGLDALKEKIAPYKFKNCFGCLYADYSPYGQGFFGDMMCFKNQKEAYLLLNEGFSKEKFFDIIDDGFIFVQETYCCEDFELRSDGSGYRG